MKTYHVLMSESLGKTIEIEAESGEEAMRMVDNGDWYDKQVVKEKVVDRFAIEAEEMIDVGSLIERFGTNDNQS
tara:strand:- start:95 stop:316 length:222 start_codon:yes stop_codon:yes gene_type:complete